MSREVIYERGARTLLGSWEEYARGAAGAELRRLPGVAVGVFPNELEGAIYNNALLARDLEGAKGVEALDAMEAAYAHAGVDAYAAWVHESDAAMLADIDRRGYALDETSRAMGMALADIRTPRPQVELGPPDWFDYLRLLGVPPDFLAHADRSALPGRWPTC